MGVSKRFLVPRVVGALVVATVALGVGAPSASATSEHQLSRTLGAVWQTTLQTPADQNPLAAGKMWCVELPGGILAPSGPLGDLSVTCPVKPGTRVFMSVIGAECSTAEAPPFYGADEEQMRDCAIEAIAGITTHTLTVDGQPTPVQEVQSPLIPLDLPADNILGVAPQHAFSVADNWVTMLHPMTPGTHVLTLQDAGTLLAGTPFEFPVDFTQTITVVVQPGYGSHASG